MCPFESALPINALLSVGAPVSHMPDDCPPALAPSEPGLCPCA
ncbi:hypothetical protein [Stutzerimonas stutzeri]|nr:hypothetical protein [Stutzerimonas stutzeri]